MSSSSFFLLFLASSMELWTHSSQELSSQTTKLAKERLEEKSKKYKERGGKKQLDWRVTTSDWDNPNKQHNLGMVNIS